VSVHAWLWPAAASQNSGAVDALFIALVIFSGAMAAAFYAAIFVFGIRYRRGSAAARGNPPDSRRGLEALWTLAPLLVFLGLYAWSARQYAGHYRAPPDAMPVYVVAKQWMWTLQHRNGHRELNELHVPAGQAVRLVMASQDVIHSFFVPAFRLKQDVVPGRYTTIWFRATKPGIYPLFCAEYCGTEHSRMTGQIVVMTPEAFAQWLERGPAGSELARRGGRLFVDKGCSGCHAAGSSVHAPSLDGLFGRRVMLAGGASVIADEVYLRDSMLLPARQVVAGYEPLMPSFRGLLSEDELIALTEYLRERR
jgi:cytochrome c oxidase subunit 2